ncbi:MAG TPA: hypothetical protein VHQ70_03520 [Syntrophomonadaceae bacterium]|nr:hypothetical protein [Syntrophomonadaceae bacterium]
MVGNAGSFDKLVLDLTNEIFEGKPRLNDNPKARHLFATAITPDGPVSHLETVVGHLNKRYIINGDDGTGKTILVQRLMETAYFYDLLSYRTIKNGAGNVSVGTCVLLKTLQGIQIHFRT